MTASGRAVARPRILLDTGFFIALFDRLDAHHERVGAWLRGCDAELHTVPSTVAEAAHFLPPRSRALLARTVARGAIRIQTPDTAGYARVAELFDKYADFDPDWTDLELVWLAEVTGIRRIATVDVADFSVYRIHGRARFELELLR